MLVSKVEEEKKDGFDMVEIQDSFIYKGKVESLSVDQPSSLVLIGDTVLFAKYSPDANEVEIDGKTMKIINVSDILAVL